MGLIPRLSTVWNLRIPARPRIRHPSDWSNPSALRRAETAKAIGRYNGLVMRAGMKSLFNQVEDLGRKAAPMIDGFFEGLTEKED